jgi:hypothetical protein
MRRLVKAITGLINPEDREKDVKLLAFGAVVLAAIVWLTREQMARGITSYWVDAFMWLCALVGIGGAGWAAVEKWKGGKGAAQQTTGAGAPDEGGKP